MIYSIWAMDSNWLIGKGNELPWHYKEDLAFFKEMTKGKTVLMGDLTYQSLKGYYKEKPLPFGKMYIANLEYKEYADATVILDAVKFVKEFKDDLYIIGGRMIYKITLPYVDRLYITHVLGFHEGDVYFPSFELSKYKLIEKRMSNNLIFATYDK